MFKPKPYKMGLQVPLYVVVPGDCVAGNRGAIRPVERRDSIVGSIICCFLIGLSV
jgi:hypothetical protein